MWDLLRGAAQLKQPARGDLGRRYTELLSENLGQPGFRELVIAVHDLDAHRDLIFALVGERRRRDLVRRPTTEEAEARRAEVLDLSGVARDHLADAVAGSLAIPLATDVHADPVRARRLLARRNPSPLRPSRRAWCACSRSWRRSTSSRSCWSRPRPSRPVRTRWRGRGSTAAAASASTCSPSEAAMVRDVARSTEKAGPRVFTIRPAHNPIGPFDFAGGFDDRSDRRQPLAELMTRGYEDAYHQFIEPVVGASGERVGQAST